MLILVNQLECLLSSFICKGSHFFLDEIVFIRINVYRFHGDFNNFAIRLGI